MYRNITKYIILLAITLTPLTAQPWNYDFGNSTGTHTAGASLTFLPTPPTDSARVRIGAGGSFNLENQSFPFGSNSYLRISASTSTSVNKFSVLGYNASKTATIRFKVRFGASNGSSTGAASGTWQFFLGDGPTYSDNAGFAGAQVFTGLQFIFGSSGAITTQYRNSSAWIATGLPASPFSQGIDYDVEIYANNSTSSQSYEYGGVQSLAANTWDLWVNGVLIGNDLTKAGYPANTNFDSFMFTGVSSSGNVANIFLDDFYYHNDIAGTPLPVSMGSFELNVINRSALLSWNTLSEINNSGFVVERCMLEGNRETEWINAGFVRGYGTTNEPRVYSFEDAGLKAGRFKYRLKQVDYNGNFEYFTPANILYAEITKPTEFFMGQNYPNPSNPVTTIDYQVPFESMVNLTVYDVTGRSVKELVNAFQSADYYSVTFDGSDLATGVYFYRIHGTAGKQAFSKTIKMMLIK